MEQRSVREILGRDPQALNMKMFEDAKDMFEDQTEKAQVMEHV